MWGTASHLPCLDYDTPIFRELVCNLIYNADFILFSRIEIGAPELEIFLKQVYRPNQIGGTTLKYSQAEEIDCVSVTHIVNILYYILFFGSHIVFRRRVHHKTTFRLLKY